MSRVFFKLGLKNVKTAIITMLQLHRKHNLGNNSDFTSAYQTLICSSCLTLLLFQEVPGLPWGGGARGQACWALPQAGSEHASATRSWARCMPPQVTSSQAPASLQQGTCPQGRAHRRAFRKGKEWCCTWDSFSKLVNKPQVGCWLPSTPGSVYHRLGHGVRGQNTGRQLHQWPGVLPQANI